MDLHELARLALKALEIQEEARTRPGPQTAAHARDAERRLKKACEDILSPPQPTLFDRPIREAE
jgi:hypothetical protein